MSVLYSVITKLLIIVTFQFYICDTSSHTLSLLAGEIAGSAAEKLVQNQFRTDYTAAEVEQEEANGSGSDDSVHEVCKQVTKANFHLMMFEQAMFQGNISQGARKKPHSKEYLENILKIILFHYAYLIIKYGKNYLNFFHNIECLNMV